MASIVKCSLCTESSTSENKIVNCNGCGLSVHILCYGIRNDDANSSEWKCSPCRRGDVRPIICELCQQANGAFKQSVCGKWVHIICALFTDGVKFDDPIQMEPVNLSKILNLKRQEPCVFCLKAHGFCCLCSKSRCKNSIHITCAQANKCLQVLKNDANDLIKCRAFCNDHRPKDPVHCLSSSIVQKILAKKTRKDRGISQSSKIQMDWVGNLARESFAFEIDPIGIYERNPSKLAQQPTFRKSSAIELASTSNTALASKLFPRFDSIDGKRDFYPFFSI